MSGEHKGGFGDPTSGFNEAGNPLSVSFGWGSRDGNTLLADGTDKLPESTAKDQHNCDFMHSENHNDYGSGDGPNDNAADRGQYSGPGA